MNLRMLVDEFVFDCKVRNLSDRTINGYEKQLGYFLNYLEKEHDVYELKDLSKQHIKGFINVYKKKGSKTSYINDLLKAVKCFCRYLYNEEYTPQLLTDKVSNVKEPKVLIHTFSEKEITDMINYHKGMDYLSIRNKVITMILFDTGIRLSELTTMRLDQIQDSCFLIHVKGRKDRLVPKNELVGKWLTKYLYVRNSKFEYKAVPDYLMALAKEQIKLAFSQAEKEVEFLRKRTSEGMRQAQANGTRLGTAPGSTFTTKKSIAAKEIIAKHSKAFGGSLDDGEVMKLCGCARNTYYKYKREIAQGGEVNQLKIKND